MADQTTTKTRIDPALKEVYGTGVAVQANREAKMLQEFRVCPNCGNKRMGAYCRNCGVATMPRTKRRGTNQPQSKGEVKKEVKSGADTAQNYGPR